MQTSRASVFGVDLQAQSSMSLKPESAADSGGLPSAATGRLGPRKPPDVRDCGCWDSGRPDKTQRHSVTVKRVPSRSPNLGPDSSLNMWPNTANHRLQNYTNAR